MEKSRDGYGVGGELVGKIRTACHYALTKHHGGIIDPEGVFEQTSGMVEVVAHRGRSIKEAEGFKILDDIFYVLASCLTEQGAEAFARSRF